MCTHCKFKTKQGTLLMQLPWTLRPPKRRTTYHRTNGLVSWAFFSYLAIAPRKMPTLCRSHGGTLSEMRFCKSPSAWRRRNLKLKTMRNDFNVLMRKRNSFFWVAHLHVFFLPSNALRMAVPSVFTNSTGYAVQKDSQQA